MKISTDRVQRNLVYLASSTTAILHSTIRVMDLSKLPKLGQSTAAPPTATEHAQIKPPIRTADLNVDAVIAGLLGLVFLFLGLNFGGWLISHLGNTPHNTGVNWTAGPMAGQPVAYFDLQGGTAWLETGEFVLGICLLLEAALLMTAMFTYRGVRSILIGCVALGLIGAAVNLLAVVMQIRMGYTQPIMSIIAMAVGCLTAFFHARRLLGQ